MTTFTDRIDAAKQHIERAGKEFFGHHEKNEKDELIFLGMNREDRRKMAKETRIRGANLRKHQSRLTAIQRRLSRSDS